MIARYPDPSTGRTMAAIPWKPIASAFGWRAGFIMAGPFPRMVVRHPHDDRHFGGGDAWKRAVLHSIRAPIIPN